MPTLQHSKPKGSQYTSASKKHNSPGMVEFKAQLRRDVMADLREQGAEEVRVFDAFCGPVGEMFAHAWHEADAYVGCDEDYVFPDLRHRYVGDNRRVMRAIDLSAFNVFDLDAYGSPWEQMVILAARRSWSKGELGAVVLTDSTHAKMNLGGIPKALAFLCGLESTSGAGTAPSRGTGDALQPMALARWAQRSRVQILRHRKAEGHGSL